MNKPDDILPVTLFSELFMVEQLGRSVISKALPMGLEINQFSVLNHLAGGHDEKSPAQLARAFHLTRGAMTNTLNRLEWAGYVHIRPDWEDARRKMVSISPAGRRARDLAVEAVTPILADLMSEIGSEKVRHIIPVLRALRERLDQDGC